MDMEGVLTARRCPDDRTAMVEVDRFGTIIDICPTCSGAWFDVHELEAITDHAARRIAQIKIDQCGTELSPERLHPLFNRQFKLPTDTPLRFCPCEGTSMELKERNGVIIDWCPICRGIWCDKGELDAIIHNTARLLVQSGNYHDIAKIPLPLDSDTEPPKCLREGISGPVLLRTMRENTHGKIKIDGSIEDMVSPQDVLRISTKIICKGMPVDLPFIIELLIDFGYGAFRLLNRSKNARHEIQDHELLRYAIKLDAERQRTESSKPQDE